ncbi:DUF2785 domain-containing protein [Sutcliffiella cohnii]
MNILFVCTDNFTRSVVAEFCLKHYIKENNIDSIKVASAGVRANSDTSKYSSIHFDRMKELNIDTSSFKRTPFKHEFFEHYDFIIAMGIEHKKYLEETYGKKIHLFNEILLGEETSLVVPPPDKDGKYLLEINKMVDTLHEAMPLFVVKLKELQVKRKLKSIDFSNLKTEVVSLVLDDMLQHIGSTDGELRDEHIYTTFGKLILGDYLTSDQMTSILRICLSKEYLFYEIGEINRDSGFKRAFSSLVITLILIKDKQQSFLSTETVRETMNLVISYMQQEKDVRGYVDGKGWAHAIAHGADLLDAVVNHPSFSIVKAREILNVIGNSLLCNDIYIDDEDERLTVPVVSLLQKGISEETIIDWLISLFKETHDGLQLNDFRKRTNLSNFFKTLYFHFLFKNSGAMIRQTIENLLKNKQGTVITSL